MDSNLRRSIILEHYQNPHNRGLVEGENYIKTNMNNESCIDELNVMLKTEEGIIKDIKFDGEACALCISSASIMTDTLIGKTLEETEKILENILNMATEKPYDKDIIEEAIVYDDISKSPNREKCVLLSWWAIEKILNKIKDKNRK